MEMDLTFIDPSGIHNQHLRFRAHLVIGDGFAQGIEISFFLEVMARHITNEVLPLFQKLFD